MPGAASDDRLASALARFDALNDEDPRRERDPVSGQEVGFEVLYGRRMSRRLAEFALDASEALRLAVRAQHIARWRIPRDRHPEGRAGYKRWRSELARMHADVAGGILREVGYDEPTIERVRELLLKRGLRHDDETQILEDVACLVFLEHYFADFARKHERAKLVDIVQKTWKKMTPRGHEAAGALAAHLSDELRSIVNDALAAAGGE
jgi:Domain of unknown function (DUF4202)